MIYVHLMKKFILSLFLFINFIPAESQINRVVRGVWIATFYNIDWPQRNQTVEQQKSSLVQMLDTLKNTGFNTIYFQIRSQCDAMYPSSIDPWSADLTGTQGLAPNPMWDPLQFAIEESHKRNMELHAWINPYRAISNSNSSQKFSQNHVSIQHPEWLLTSGTLKTLNPALQEVRDYITDVITDIITRYDVDGIHFDDYFYPEGNYNDDASYKLSDSKFLTKADWRRNNVDLLIKQVSDKINEKKSWIKFGISPTGIYQNSPDESVGSATRGKQHYSELFSDTKKWLKEGWIDYLEPQLYWYFSQPGSAFDVLTKWWNNNSFNRDMYIGIGAYKVGINDGWRNPSEISNQIRYALSPEMPNIKGVSIFSAVSVLNNRLGLKDSMRILFKTKSLIPPMLWKDDVPPSKPKNITITKVNEGYKIQWDIDTSTNEYDVVKNHVIYSSSTLPVILSSENVLDIISSENFYIDKNPSITNSYYAVTSVDRLKNESEPSDIVNTSNQSFPLSKPVTETKPLKNLNKLAEVKLYASPKLNNAITLRWEDKSFKTADEYLLEKSLNNIDFSLVAKFKPKAEFMFYDVYQLFESCFFRVKRMENGVSFYSNVINYKVESLITKKVSQETKIVKKEIPDQTKDLNLLTETKPKTVSDIVNKPDSNSKSKNIYPTFKENPNKLGTVSIKYKKSGPVSILINTIGQIEYTLYKKSGEKITWGKIKSNSTKSKVALPGTQNLQAGEYKIELKKSPDVEISFFIIE